MQTYGKGLSQSRHLVGDRIRDGYQILDGNFNKPCKSPRSCKPDRATLLAEVIVTAPTPATVPAPQDGVQRHSHPEINTRRVAAEGRDDPTHLVPKDHRWAGAGQWMGVEANHVWPMQVLVQIRATDPAVRDLDHSAARTAGLWLVDLVQA